SRSSSLYGQAVFFTATVRTSTPGAGIATGTVTFYDGKTKLGTASLDATGHATLRITSLGLGAHSVSACYEGDGDRAVSKATAASSGSLSETVSQASTVTTVHSSLSNPVFGQTVTFTTGVVAKLPGGGVPTGTVTFKDGTHVLGTVSLDSTGHASLNVGLATVG